jgi:hypothetical protein
MPNRGPTLTVRPWDARDGDPADPERVFGVAVDHVIAARHDAAGALVALADRRVALTGPIAAIGRHHALRSYIRSRAHEMRDGADRAWLEQVLSILEQIHPESRVQRADWHRELPHARSRRRKTGLPYDRWPPNGSA